MYKYLLFLGMIFVCLGGFVSLSSDFVFSSILKKNIEAAYGVKPSMKSIGVHFLDKEVVINDLESQTSKDRTRLIKVNKVSLKFGGASIFTTNLEGKDLIFDEVYMKIKLDSVGDNKQDFKVENNFIERLLLSQVAQNISIRKVVLNKVHIRVVSETVDKQIEMQNLEWSGLSIKTGVQDLIQQIAHKLQKGLDNEIVSRLKLQVADDLGTQVKNKFMDYLNTSGDGTASDLLNNTKENLKGKLIDIFNKTLSPEGTK
ncbi:MAG: hypothetical protein KC646_17485 [Candidatus Cloacimonetes bacterium]|nr:hypothetical protein [Candidatus Cloacimonadota bacterium]